MDLAGRITSLRKARNLTQIDLGKRLCLNQSVVNRIEKGTRPVRDDELKAIAQLFNVSVDYLLGNDAKKKDDPQLSPEAMKLANDYDRLNNEGRSVLRRMLDSLIVTNARRDRALQA